MPVLWKDPLKELNQKTEVSEDIPVFKWFTDNTRQNFIFNFTDNAKKLHDGLWITSAGIIDTGTWVSPSSNVLPNNYYYQHKDYFTYLTDFISNQFSTILQGSSILFFGDSMANQFFAQSSNWMEKISTDTLLFDKQLKEEVKKLVFDEESGNPQPNCPKLGSWTIEYGRIKSFGSNNKPIKLFRIPQGLPVQKGICPEHMMFEPELVLQKLGFLIENNWDFQNNTILGTDFQPVIENKFVFVFTHALHWIVHNPKLYLEKLKSIYQSIVKFKKLVPNALFIYKTPNFVRSDYKYFWNGMNQFSILLYRQMIFEVFGQEGDDLVEIFDIFPMSETVFDYMKIDNVHIPAFRPKAEDLKAENTTMSRFREEHFILTPFWKHFLDFMMEKMEDADSGGGLEK